MKRLKFILQHVDGIWSIPLTFALFWVAGIVLQTLFGYTTGVYDMSFIQPLFLAASIVIGATNVATYALYFSFRGLYKFLYGQKDKDGKIVNSSKINWLSLLPWQRFLITLFVFFFYVTATITVYLKLV